MDVASSDKHFGREEVDLFALSESAQCLLSHPAPLGIEALAHPWPRLRFYIFPPIKLIPLVLSRLQEDKIRFLLVTILVTQICFAKLISYLESPPREIPIRADLLTQAQGRIWHPCPRIWRLWVWPLSGDL